MENIIPLSENNATDPQEYKRMCVKNVTGRYSLKELSGILQAVKGSKDLTLNEVLDKIVAGNFNVSDETPEGKQVHMKINGDLCQHFIDCQKVLGTKEINKEKIQNFDFLHDSWDMRKPAERKLSKLKSLIKDYAPDDEDLNKAIIDLEWLYKGKR